MLLLHQAAAYVVGLDACHPAKPGLVRMSGAIGLGGLVASQLQIVVVPIQSRAENASRAGLRCRGPCKDCKRARTAVECAAKAIPLVPPSPARQADTVTSHTPFDRHSCHCRSKVNKRFPINVTI